MLPLLKSFIMIIRLFFILCILVGCTTKNENSKEKVPNKFNFNLKKLKSIHLGGLDISLSYALQYPGSDLVYFTNFNNEEKLCIYSLNLIDFEIKTLLKIKTDFQFETYSIDEQHSRIYLFTGDEIIAYNFKNELLSRESFGTLEKGYLSNQNPTGFYPYCKDNLLFIEYFPNIKETFKSRLFYRQPFQATFNLKTKKSELLKMTYPNEYQKKCFGYNFIPDRIIGNQNTHIISFPYTDSVYIYNDLGQLQMTKYFGVKARPNFQYIPYDELKNLQQEIFDEFNKDMPHYGFSTYFSFSKIYSRQLIQYNKMTNKSTCNIVFYDMNWNYLGEIKKSGIMSLFDSKKYGIVKIQKNDNNLELYEVSI